MEFDPAPDEAIREHILRAAKACPVQAISIGWTDDAIGRSATAARSST
jgi:hypothetical protein